MSDLPLSVPAPLDALRGYRDALSDLVDAGYMDGQSPAWRVCVHCDTESCRDWPAGESAAHDDRCPMRAAEKALAALQVLPHGWQPIASAPKDGTWIIILMRNEQVWRASWGIDRSGEANWCTDKLSLAGCVVTHWMPLPPTPPPPGPQP